jgi:hypothetical protein
MMKHEMDLHVFNPPGASRASDRVARIRGLHRAITRADRDNLKLAVDLGNLLEQEKEACLRANPAIEWYTRLKELGISPRTSGDYRAVAKAHREGSLPAAPADMGLTEALIHTRAVRQAARAARAAAEAEDTPRDSPQEPAQDSPRDPPDELQENVQGTPSPAPEEPASQTQERSRRDPARGKCIWPAARKLLEGSIIETRPADLLKIRCLINARQLEIARVVRKHNPPSYAEAEKLLHPVLPIAEVRVLTPADNEALRKILARASGWTSKERRDHVAVFRALASRIAGLELVEDDQGASEK